MPKTKVSRTEDFHLNLKRPEYNMIGEVTLSHILRYENDFIRSGLPYGMQLFDSLYSSDSIQEKPKILEIGIGLAQVIDRFDFRFRDVDPILHQNAEYTLVDLSESLLNFANMRFSLTRRNYFNTIKADATNLPLKPSSHNLIISNEVMADLPTVTNINKRKLRRELRTGKNETKIKNKRDRKAYQDTVRMFKQYGLQFKDAPRFFNFNYGGIRLLEEMSRVLSPGGTAFIVEYDCESQPFGYPRPLRLINHTEYGIRLDHIKTAAKGLGFQIQDGYAHEFLNIDSSKMMVDTEALGILHRKLIDLRDKKPNSEFLMNAVGMTSPKALTRKQFSVIIDELKWLEKQEEKEELLKSTMRPMSDFSGNFKYMLLKKT